LEAEKEPAKAFMGKNIANVVQPFHHIAKSFHLLTFQSFCSKSCAWRHTERCIAFNYDVECVAFILKCIEILFAGKEFCFDGNIKLVSQEFSLLGVCPWELQLDLR